MKGIFRDGDLELPLVNIGVAIENENEARVSIPDRVFEVFDQYKYTGELGDANISSEKTSRLNLNEGNKLLEIIELLDHHSEMNLNSVEGIGMTVHSSNDFAKFFYSLFSDYKGLSLEESFSRVNSPLAKVLSQEYEYFKKNKPEKYEKGIETESIRTKVSQTESDESDESEDEDEVQEEVKEEVKEEENPPQSPKTDESEEESDESEEEEEEEDNYEEIQKVKYVILDGNAYDIETKTLMGPIASTPSETDTSKWKKSARKLHKKNIDQIMSEK